MLTCHIGLRSRMNLICTVFYYVCNISLLLDTLPLIANTPPLVISHTVFHIHSRSLSANVINGCSQIGNPDVLQTASAKSCFNPSIQRCPHFGLKLVQTPPQHHLSGKIQGRASDTCSVRADGLCIGSPRLVGGRKAGNSNMQDFFLTTLYSGFE